MRTDNLLIGFSGFLKKKKKERKKNKRCTWSLKVCVYEAKFQRMGVGKYDWGTYEIFKKLKNTGVIPLKFYIFPVQRLQETLLFISIPDN